MTLWAGGTSPAVSISNLQLPLQTRHPSSSSAGLSCVLWDAETPRPSPPEGQEVTRTMYLEHCLPLKKGPEELFTSEPEYLCFAAGKFRISTLKLFAGNLPG